MKQILIFGGTTEGRLAAECLSKAGLSVSVSVATDIGAEALCDVSGLSVLIGRRNEQEMRYLVSGFDLCIDATHPYALDASRTIYSACENIGIPYYRLLRPIDQNENHFSFNSHFEIANYLANQSGNILLTIGSKYISNYATIDFHRLYIRVLPTHDALYACEDIGLPHSHILAMQGPFSKELNVALLRQFQIKWLVTKNSGAPGGFKEKSAAAREAGTNLILLRRPEEQGWDYVSLMKEILRLCKE